MSAKESSTLNGIVAGDLGDEYLTRFIAELGRSISFGDLPQSVVERVKCCFLDWFGVTLTGAATPVAEILRKVTLRGAGRGHAGVIGGDYPAVGPVDAALINGTTAHALDFDDGAEVPDLNFGVTYHPSASSISAALALAQSEDVSGAGFIEAVVTAQETMIRVAGFIGLSHHGTGWHATGTLGSFGAATAGAKLLGLDLESWEMAIGIAGNQASGLRSMFGTMCKPVNAGKAASNGVQAALLASEGFTSTPNVLGARYGFGWTHSTETYPERLMRPLGPPYVAERSRFKMHASCGGTHCAITAMSRLKDEHGITAHDVERITVRVPVARTTSCNIETPRTGLEGKFSLRYTTAAALLGWDTTGACFSDAAVTAHEAVEVMRRVKVQGIDLPTVEGPTEVEVVLKDGRRLSATVPDDERGGPTDWEGLTEKYLRLAIPVLGEERTISILGRIEKLENLESMRWFHEELRSPVAIRSS